MTTTLPQYKGLVCDWVTDQWEANIRVNCP